MTDGCVAKWVQRPGMLKLVSDATFPAFMKGAIPTYETKEETGYFFVAGDCA